MMDKIIDGLYVGGIMDARDEAQLKQNKITHILAIHDHEHTEIKGLTYHYINADDHPDQSLSPYFQDCINFIHKHRLEDKNVLVHCLAGVSRSVTIVVSYLMTITTLGWENCLEIVRKSRKWANPNAGFQKELQAYETGTLEQERNRVQDKFKMGILTSEESSQLLMIKGDDTAKSQI